MVAAENAQSAQNANGQKRRTPSPQLAAATASAISDGQRKLLRPGEVWSLNGYDLEYRQSRPVTHPHYAGAVARLALSQHGKPIGILLPEKRMYYQQDQPATIPAVSSTLREDFYVILVGVEPDRSVAVKVYINPLVNWIWIGGFVFVFGNTLLLWPLPKRLAGRTES